MRAGWPGAPGRAAACSGAALAFLLLAAAGVAPAAAAPVTAAGAPSVAADAVVVPPGTALLPTVERRHRGRFGGRALRYRSVVEEWPLIDDAGATVATVASIAYLAEGADPQRPVIFAFNGGPGSASVWLHMGFLGPKRPHYGMQAGDAETRPPTAPPFALVDNPESPLDVADVVLIDPPGTGLARVMGEAGTAQVFGVDEDATAISRFIVDWLRRHGREHSPRYLMGESYGTVRAAEVARLLAGGPTASGRMDGITLNGVMLLGQAMDGSRRGPELASATGLPSYAATAWYHRAVPQDVPLEAHVARARAFAEGPYLQALFQGSRLDAAERAAVAEELAALTGIAAARWQALDLRMDATAFGREVLGDAGLQVGAYDARFTLPLAASGGDPVADDPAMGQYVPLYLATLQTHLREHLGVDTARAYNAIEFRHVNARFWKGQAPLQANHALALATAMRRNPELRVLVATGRYDLVTTVGAADQTVALSGMPPERVTMRAYPSGHMPYVGVVSRAQLAADVRAFVTGAPSP
ncbi:S10 family peptidase [Luteimonas abyssi]|uniref:S10 family peptidase n=1 Tax=Luteimonas abyssi TaxID=1247514 RepID=UPI0012F94867|nr:peptidase S10 [Luteimonas abyssi]